VARTRRRSEKPLDVALAATLHDPPGALARELRRALPALQSLYSSIAVTTSPPTSSATKRLLDAGGVHAGTPAANLRGPLYRLSVREAARTGAARVHYLDLDRALHWIARRRREMRSALRAACRHDAIVLGRTLKAHRSHQLPLFATEGVVNRLMSERAGIRGRFDWLVPSFVLTNELARRLVRSSRARDTNLYGEWTALVLDLAPRLAYLECRGLDWETPDRHRRAVRRVGLAAWRRRLETPAEWALRVDMARTIVTGFERAHARRPARGVSIQRLRVRWG
jgi:hypothetical protein